MNRNYVNGRAKEYRLMNKYRKAGKGDYIIIRASGSHGPFDIIVIDKVVKRIMFIQSKPNNFLVSKKNKLEEEYNWINDNFQCSFGVE